MGVAPLPPDLVTLSVGPDDLHLASEHGRRVLELSNEISNRGAGPLEVFPSAASANCDGDGDPANDRDASQRVFADSNGSGAFERGTDAVASERLFGCMRYHVAHDHWHVLDFARYELRSEATGKLAASTRKVGFCLGDNRRAFAGPLSPETPGLPLRLDDETPCDSMATQGLSVGWADIYLYYVPGQQIEIETVPDGRYCLVSRADPRDLLDELSELNNVRRTRIELAARATRCGSCQRPCRVSSSIPESAWHLLRF